MVRFLLPKISSFFVQSVQTQRIIHIPPVHVASTGGNNGFVLGKNPWNGREIEILVNMVCCGECPQEKGNQRSRGRRGRSWGHDLRLVPFIGSSGAQILYHLVVPSWDKGAGLCILLSLSHWPWLTPGGSGVWYLRQGGPLLAENNSLKKRAPVRH